ncbi:hypothetical protein GCM10007052_23890 [Halioglobus japonicus]|nr:hypothetical protein GCM10007052_23890 [Halioglobus japonicus]
MLREQTRATSLGRGGRNHQATLFAQREAAQGFSWWVFEECFGIALQFLLRVTPRPELPELPERSFVAVPPASIQ